MSDNEKAVGDFQNEGSNLSYHQPPTEAPPPPPPPPPPDVELIVDGFGFLPGYRNTKDADDENAQDDKSCSSSSDAYLVRRYTWKTKNHFTAQVSCSSLVNYLAIVVHWQYYLFLYSLRGWVITYGATITSIKAPNRKGIPEDVLAGFDDLDGYLRRDNPYFGGCIGRCANYVKDAAMQVKPSGRVYMLSMNKGRHHYHGGYMGFDKVNWRSYKDGLKVVMSHVSEDGNEGYPGSIIVQLTFEVVVENILKISMKCTTTKSTVLNISYTPFFNLCGHHAGPEELYKHIFTINADKFIPTDEEHVVIANKRAVGGTGYDFRTPRRLCEVINKVPMGGYDIDMCVTKGSAQCLTFVSRVIHPEQGRVLEIYSTLPGVNFYTGNLLPDPQKIIEQMADDESEMDGYEDLAVDEMGEDDQSDSKDKEGIVGAGYKELKGKQGTCYFKHGLFCLSPQFYPDAINNPTFPTTILHPGQTYEHKIEYRFGLLLGRYL